VSALVIQLMRDQPINTGRIEELGSGKKLYYRMINSELLRTTQKVHYIRREKRYPSMKMGLDRFIK